MWSEQLLSILRAYWRAERPKEWLFPGVDPERPITTRALQYACRHGGNNPHSSRGLTAVQCNKVSATALDGVAAPSARASPSQKP